ncbi:MAG: DEAD/DEAH box helicase [Erysipelotrichaceae bacterium]|nr:DEAD/DEAH box helicase [Erysipelotrichaceae bacterium]
MDDKDLLIAELRNENEYLKKLLVSHNIGFEKPKEITRYNLTSDEKIKSCLSYFVGRDDIFAYQYITSEGKKQFYPVCKGRVNLTGYCSRRCNECDNKQYVGLTENEVKRHLVGNDLFGMYPLLDGDVCRLLAIVFDDEDYKESALAFSSICKKYNLDNLVEISSSGCGAHIWLFFNSDIKAAKVRRLGSYLLYEAMDSSKGINFDSLDRMFPSQDYVPKNGYGNLIALPLQGKKAKEGKTVFVDNNFIPYDLKDQINVLLSTKKITEEEIDILLKEFKENDFFPLLSKNVLKNIKLNRNDFAKEIVIIKQNEIVVPKAGLNDRSVRFIYRLASLPNPQYYEAQQQRRSVYNVPRVLKLYSEDESFIYLPRGCYEDLIKVLNFFDVKINLVDKQVNGDLITVSFKGSLKEYQKDGLDKLLKYDNGLFVAPPAFGKTVTAIALIAELKTNTLIIVPSIALLSQWNERLNQFLEVGYEYKKEKDKFGVYHGSKKKLTNKIDVACIDSLVGEEGDEILKHYGLVILDEVHHIGAITYEKVVRKCYSKYLYGFTATPKRSDKNEKIIYKTIGDIRYQYKDNGDALEKILKPEFTFFTFSSLDRTMGYADMLSALLNDEERNKKIADDIRKAYKQKRNSLVLTDRIEHINILRNLLDDLDNVFIINGQLSKNEKDDFYKNIRSVRNGFVIISTGKFIGEGFDDKRLDTLFIVSPFRWNGTLEQYVGRLHRSNEDKHSVEVHDYIDINVGLFANMYHERLRGYRKLGYIIDGDEVVFEKKIYSTYDYRNKLLDDIKESKTEVVFVINSYEIESLKELLDVGNRIKVYISAKSEIEHKNIAGLYKTTLEINAVIIDNKIMWYGGINPFKTSTFNDSIMRINDKDVASNVLKELESNKNISKTAILLNHYPSTK